MEKVKLNQKAADALEVLKAKGCSLPGIVHDHILKKLITVNDFEELYKFPSDTIIRALYIGYEVEQTPEDKVRDHFNQLQKDLLETHPENNNRFYLDGQMRGIAKALDLLNVKIEGVNT